MPSSKTKKYFSIMTFILLITDIAAVSYFRKPLLILLLYIYFVAEKEGEKQKKIKQYKKRIKDVPKRER